MLAPVGVLSLPPAAAAAAATRPAAHLVAQLSAPPPVAWLHVAQRVGPLPAASLPVAP